MSQAGTVMELDAGKSPEQLCAERLKRFVDAIELRQPDRIPLLIRLGYLLAELGHMSHLEVHTNPAKAADALIEAGRRFRPDAIYGAWGSGEPSRILGDQSTKWPGYGLGPDGSFQYHEQDFMKAEDYDDFIEDPGDWAVRVLLPRVFTELEGLSLLPPLGIGSQGFYGLMPNLTIFNDPKMVKTMQALVEAAQAAAKSRADLMEITEKLAKAGFPRGPLEGPLLAAPFDFMSDTLRGMKGIFTDMRRHPEKLLAAETKASNLMLKHAIAATASVKKAGGKPVVGFPLHRGDDNFMSIANFERFYWPQLKDLLLKVIDNGMTPFVFYEGQWNDRLKYIAELPKGRSIAYFQHTDIFKAKEILGDTACIMGGMPVSLLAGGTAAEVRERTKKVCEVCGKGGGFIMTTDIGELQGRDPALIQVWADATREFGQY
jgi:uroporphyrinogen-III decarboxylase